MAKKAPVALVAKRVWRITAAAPMGEYVTSTRHVQSTPELAEPEVTHGGWIESSFDLLRGVDVIEHGDPFPSEQPAPPSFEQDDEDWPDTQLPE